MNTSSPATHGESRKRKFVRDVGIYAIGNIGAKLITFLMVPLYTHFIADTADFGYYDVCLTACFLLLPLVSLQLRDGAFRFLLECDDTQSRTRVVTTVYRTLAVSLALSLCLLATASMWLQVDYVWWSLALLVSMAIQEVVMQVYRGLGNNRAFVTVGILTALGIGLFSLFFVVVLRWGVEGIFAANIAARLLAIALVELRVGSVKRYFALGIDVSAMRRELLRYSLPLLPGALCWWIMGSSDRWFILHYLGPADTGVYAVAVRFTGVIQTLGIIFYQAWQETAIRQYNSPDRNSFFSLMLNAYAWLLAALLVAYTIGLKVCYPWLVAQQYQASLAYVFPLGCIAAIMAIVAFFDMGYQCTKDTVRTLPAIVVGAIVNIVANVVLTPRWGVPGTLAAGILTYLVLVVYRWHDMRRYFTLRLQWRTALALAIVAVTAVVFYAQWPLWADVAAAVALLALCIACAPPRVRHLVVHRPRQ